MIIFELGLFVAAGLSYPGKFLNYLIAYNLGIFAFIMAFKLKPDIEILNKFSELGFTFFLDAGLPMIILNSCINFSMSIYMQIIGWIVKFILAVALSALLVWFIEKPLLNWAKRFEKNL